MLLLCGVFDMHVVHEIHVMHEIHVLHVMYTWYAWMCVCVMDVWYVCNACSACYVYDTIIRRATALVPPTRSMAAEGRKAARPCPCLV